MTFKMYAIFWGLKDPFKDKCMNEKSNYKSMPMVTLLKMDHQNSCVNFFFGIYLYAWSQSQFSENATQGILSKSIFKKLQKSFLTIQFLTVYDIVSKFFNFSLTVVKRIVAKNQTPRATACLSKQGQKSLFDVIFTDFTSKRRFQTLIRQLYSSLKALLFLLKHVL